MLSIELAWYAVDVSFEIQNACIAQYPVIVWVDDLGLGTTDDPA